MNMNDETENVFKKTWTRAIESVNKVGYMDGAADGQAAVFQSSFDTGYEQGLNFGLELGFRKSSMPQENNLIDLNLRDLQKINCQICVNSATTQENIVNLYNTQHEKNVVLLGNKH